MIPHEAWAAWKAPACRAARGLVPVHPAPAPGHPLRQIVRVRPHGLRAGAVRCNPFGVPGARPPSSAPGTSTRRRRAGCSPTAAPAVPCPGTASSLLDNLRVTCSSLGAAPASRHLRDLRRDLGRGWPTSGLRGLRGPTRRWPMAPSATSRCPEPGADGGRSGGQAGAARRTCGAPSTTVCWRRPRWTTNCTPPAPMRRAGSRGVPERRRREVLGRRRDGPPAVPVHAA